MRYTSLLISLFLSITAALGQQLKPGESAVEFLELPFQEKFISLNHIQSISVDEQDKRTGQPIRSLNKTRTYFFNPAGQCTEVLTASLLWGRRDTILESYGINSSFKSYERKDQRGAYRETLEQKGDTLHICRYRNDGTQEQDTWISCEYIITKKDQGKNVQTIYNEDKKPYLTVTKSYGEGDFLIEERERYIISGKETVSTYSYNEKGLLGKKEKKSTSGIQEWIFTYLPDGNLEKVEYSENNIPVWKREILHDGTGKIEAILTRDIKTETIKIDKFSYTFNRH